MRFLTRLLLVLALLALPSACAKAPPSLTPVGVTDWQTLQIGHDLDLLRDVVDEGSKTSPAVFTHALDVQVATWHKAAVSTLASRSAGWKVTLVTSVDQLMASLSDADKAKLTPYALLIKTVLASL